jgi:NADP+-dependent farnesol dehydrogenase
MEKWIGKNAVITGSNSGIGLAILKKLKQEGVNVIGLARKVEKYSNVVSEEENTGKLFFRVCDVQDAASVKKAFEWIEKHVGAVDILVNSAGIFHFTNILNRDTFFNPSLGDTMQTNFLGSVYCSKEAYNSMRRHDIHGCIVNISSVGGHYVSV